MFSCLFDDLWSPPETVEQELPFALKYIIGPLITTSKNSKYCYEAHFIRIKDWEYYSIPFGDKRYIYEDLTIFKKYPSTITRNQAILMNKKHIPRFDNCLNRHFWEFWYLRKIIK